MTKEMYALSDYFYNLPEELIAQFPVSRRDGSRLLVLNREERSTAHYAFSDLPSLLGPGDLLVVNNTRVIQGRLRGTKKTGGKIEILLLDYAQAIQRKQGGVQGADHGEEPGPDQQEGLILECLIKASKPPRLGSKIEFAEGLRATVLEGDKGVFRMAFHFEGDFDTILEKTGEVPLPPYIKRNGLPAPPCDDLEVYQTVYARKRGAVAAPTAGLHFSSGLLDTLKEKGIQIVAITLHVGYGTFSPVRVSDIRKHQIHSEGYELSETAASVINEAKTAGRRVIAVGTTSVRVLEYAAGADGRVHKGTGQCDLFIYPGFEFKITDGLITNFHLPESTLLMLVSAFAGRKFILASYREAIDRKYRFFSYGDAMLIV